MRLSVQVHNVGTTAVPLDSRRKPANAVPSELCRAMGAVHGPCGRSK